MVDNIRPRGARIADRLAPRVPAAALTGLGTYLLGCLAPKYALLGYVPRGPLIAISVGVCLMVLFGASIFDKLT
jgi:hypothetical protein